MLQQDTHQVKVSCDVTFPSTSVGRETELPKVLEETSLELLEETKIETETEELPATTPLPSTNLSNNNEVNLEEPQIEEQQEDNHEGPNIEEPQV